MRYFAFGTCFRQIIMNFDTNKKWIGQQSEDSKWSPDTELRLYIWSPMQTEFRFNMKALIFLLALACAGSDHVKRYNPTFSQNQLHIYKYDGVILTGLPEKGLNRAGIRITSRVTIRALGSNQYLLQLENPQLQELNGIWPQDPFSSLRKLTERWSPLLTRPVKFEYTDGRVGNIFTSEDVPEDVLNIHRGILNILQITIKKSQNFYDLQEAGIEGICHARYIVQEDKRKERLIITKAKDLTNCQERVLMQTGTVYTQLCPSCQQRGRNIRASAASTIVLKPTAVGAIIQEARVREVHQFTPFHELDGTIRLEARQSLILEKITTAQMEQIPDMQSRRSLQYRSERNVLQQPIRLLKEQNVITQIKDTLNHMAQHNVQDVHADAPASLMQLVQLLRVAPHRAFSEIWSWAKSQPEPRRWLLEAIPAIGTIESLKFIKSRIQESETVRSEIIQALILALHQVKTDRDVLTMAREIMELDQVKRCQLTRKLAILAYGSMIFRNYAEKPICPEEILKPIHSLLSDAGNRPNDEDIVLGLKAIDNAGQPASIKNIVKLLPGFGTAAANLPLKVRVDAIMALRNIARKDPRTVQRIAVQTFLNRRNHPEERMMACAVLFATKPPLTLVSMVANSLLTETSLQVASFTHSHIRALSRSSLPSINSLAAACNLALNILSPKLEQLGHRFSKVYRVDTFMYRMMAGASAKLLLFKNSGSIIPTALLAKVRGHALGSSLDLIEVGLRAEGLQEILMKERAPDLRKTESRSIRRILSKFISWKELPEETPLASVYLKLFGQELAFAQLRKEDLDAIRQRMSSPIDSYMKKLNEGVTFNPSKALVAAEMRQVVPTVIGLPMELSIISSAVAVSNIKVDLRSDSPIGKLPRLLTSRIQLNARLNPSVSIHTRVFMGINMPQIQSGVELRANVRSIIPVGITAKINLKEGNFRIDTTPADKENRILSMISQVYAVSRNVENLSAEKITPILPSTPESRISRQRFRSSSRSSRATSMRIATHLSPETLSDQVPCSEEKQRPRVPNRSSYRTCAEATKFGVKACVDIRMENALSFKHSPLYRLMGEHTLNVSIAPVTSEPEIEKIVLEIQAGSRASSKLMRLSDKELGPDRIRSSAERLRLMRQSSTPRTRNSTMSSSSSSSSIRQSRRLASRSTSRTSSSSEYSQRRRNSKTVLPSGTSVSRKRGSKRWSSSSSSSSSSSLRSKRLSQQHISRRTSGTLRSSRRLNSRRESISRQLLELAFRPLQDSRYTVRRQSARILSASTHHSGSSRITRISRRSGSRASRASHGSSILRSSEQRYLISRVGSPSLVVLLRSRRTDGTQRGYQVTGYVKMETRLPRVHLRLVELDEKSNWKICADAAMPSSHKVLTQVRWGENCEKYRVSVRVSNGQLATHPAVKVKMQWSRIPESLKYNAKMVGDSLPGLGYALGLSQTYRRNPSRQITVLVALTSPRTIDTIIKLPKMTAYYQGLQLPASLPMHAISVRVQQKGFSTIADIPDMVLATNQRQCTVEIDVVRSFDGAELKHSLANRCYYVLTQDCSASPRFILMTRRAEIDQSKKEIKLVLASNNTIIEAIPTKSGTKLLINGAEQDPNQQIPELPDISVQQKDARIILEARTIGIERLFFDGNRVEIVLDQMISKTCGICGQNNAEKKMMKPNQEEARDVEDLFESWTYPGQSCADDCKVRREFVQLGKVIEFEGLESRCYSVEPVQRCLEGCAPIETRSQIINFHCVSSNFTVRDYTIFSRKSPDMRRSVDSHSDCMCSRCAEA
ncbi:LOW QUALITY PROTEIN: vitellogenin-like [Scyliorhinus canicula]|uniref:LOW QUALITY PROTEIN: vitellogenin-like n=1 Tax=Scyliorhinus canicula TaxID=7830 RepID=UPI0018F4925A|nr:LOW QUALITY PROTEIN: vitellogenin-like [Scyliorhinus canicula]